MHLSKLDFGPVLDSMAISNIQVIELEARLLCQNCRETVLECLASKDSRDVDTGSTATIWSISTSTCHDGIFLVAADDP